MINKKTLYHVSDTHGQLWPKINEDCDIIIHSGDGLPNASRGNLNIEIPFQTKWIEDNIEKYKVWTNNKPLIYLQGNHCFISPEEILRNNNINCVDITNKIYVLDNITFYGFPYIPFIEGEWNHEKNIYDMHIEINKLKETLTNNKIDILVAHCPIANILDYEGMHFGNTLMANLFLYDLDEKFWPKLYCCGHIHYSGGQIAKFGNMIVSNAATKLNVIDYV